jgi:hypothetical protein
MRITAPLVVLGFLAAACPTEAAAQRPHRSGFWIESGAGTGAIRIGCSTCAEPIVAYGESSYLRAGGALSSRVLLGIEVFALLDRTFGIADGDSSLTVENVSIAPVVLWYPWSGGVFLKGGVGLAHGEVIVPGPDDDRTVLASNTGSGVTFGVGFDMPIFKWLAITANLGVYYTALGDVTVAETRVDDVIASMYNANFAITIR